MKKNKAILIVAFFKHVNIRHLATTYKVAGTFLF